MQPIFALITTFFCLVFFGQNSLAQTDGNELFENSFLHEIRISSQLRPHTWDSIAREYLLVNMVIDGNTIDSVGIKLKGTTSANSEQKPLEVDLNEFVKGQKYDGLKKFVLRNNFEDSYLQRERLALEIYRRAGLPSCRTSYAEVYVDDIFRGVYSITEMIDKTFLEHYYGNDNGSLYKGDFGFRGLSVQLEEGTMEAFDNWKRNLQVDKLDQYINLDHYLKQLAVDIIIGDWDSYAYGRHNFYIYQEPVSNKLHFINWDHNFAFSAKPEARDLYPISTFPSLNNLIEAPTLKSRYETTLCELLTYVVEDDFLNNLAEANYNLIRKNKNGVRVSHPDPLLNYIQDRKLQLQDTLNKIGVQCASIQCPIEPGDIECVIKQSADLQDLNTSLTNDMAELVLVFRNNTEKPINLDRHYYLSNDPYFPKKWPLWEEVTIPAGGFYYLPINQALWQQMNGDSNSTLTLAHEDLTLIQVQTN